MMYGRSQRGGGLEGLSGLSTKHVVLGLMIDGPTYGYRLKNEMSSRLGFLELAPSVIYRIIERLENDGWVAETGRDPIGGTRRGPPRVLYAATPEGVKQFKAWIATPSDPAVVRDELQAKLAVSAPEDLPRLLETAEEQARECLAELGRIGRPAPLSKATQNLPWDRAARIMVDNFHARRLEGLVDWLNEACEVMENRIQESSDSLAGTKGP
jgi:DNA-binding PadR family transcriptional regulator